MKKMKMFNFKKTRNITQTTIALILLVSLASCAGDDKQANVTPSDLAPQTAMNPLEKYDPPIELTYPIKGSSTKKFLPGDSYEDNVWSRVIEERLGIKLKIAWEASTASDAYLNKLNMCIASGDLPDFFAIEAKQYSAAAKAGLLYDMNDIFDKLSSEKIKNIRDSFPEAFEAAKIDNKLYALPETGQDPEIGAMVWWVRDDWRKKLNLPEPKSFQDIMAIAEAFVKNDPDGNGKADTYGIGMHKDLYGNMGVIDGIGSAYHALLEKQGIWYKDDSGEIVYGAVQPQVKDALIAMQDMYRNGLIDKEFGVKDSNKVREDILSEKIGVLCGPYWHSLHPFTELVKKDPNAIFVAYPIFSADEKPAEIGVYWPIWNYVSVNAKSKYPEAIVKIINLAAEIVNEDAAEDVYETYVRKVDIENISLRPFGMGLRGSHLRAFESINKSISQNDNGISIKPYFKTNYDKVAEYISSKDPNSYGVWAQYGPGGSVGICYDYSVNGQLVLTEARGADTAAQSKYRGTLQKMEAEVFSGIIMGNSIDEFDKFVSDWKKLGGDEISKEINELYKNRQ